MLLKLLFQLRRRRDSVFQDYLGMNGIPFKFMGQANGCGFRNRRVTDQRAFDFRSSQTVIAYFNYIINAADNPDVAIFINTC